MSALTDVLDRVSNDHRAALQWFWERRSRQVSWTELQDHATAGPRLVTQAKGIYKPAGSDYALSVRQTLDSPYADKDVVHRPDGSWVYPYFQENPNPALRDQEATNRGLMKCLADQVPVGVLLQVKPKPGVAYLVLGLALVSEWKDGYFILEGFADNESLPQGASRGDAAHDRARALASAPAIEDFDPASTSDQRERQIAEVIRRRGHAKFRAALVAAYGGRCAVTGCDALEALEAAHIVPYRGDQTHHPQNGLLLRADIHSLFDLGLIGVDPTSLTLVVAPALATTTYVELRGRPLNVPSEPSSAPSREALRQHLHWAGLAPEPPEEAHAGTIKAEAV